MRGIEMNQKRGRDVYFCYKNLIIVDERYRDEPEER